VDAL
jgi:hypothetical protein